MSSSRKNLSNPISTGGGAFFEANVQALYVTLMITGGYAPFMNYGPITKVQLQGKIDGYDTDDLIVTVKNSETKEERKMLAQIKRSIEINESNKEFTDVIQAAWNDFNNPDVFTQGKDIIALITGPLSQIDAKNVQWILNQARVTNSSEDFYRRIERAKFGPPKRTEKLKVISKKLCIANNNDDVPKETIYSFLKHFFLLGYDLEYDCGVIHPLMYSHISQLSNEYPKNLWSRIVDFVSNINQNAGVITLDTIPDELIDLFKHPKITSIPTELIETQYTPKRKDQNWHPYETTLALANLVGSWDGNNDADIDVVSKVTGKNYEIFVSEIKEMLFLEESPLALKNGVWKIKNRILLWNTLGSGIFENNLNDFKEYALVVLTEQDPTFGLPPVERLKASIYGNALKHSHSLRIGIAESLALLGNSGNTLKNCSPSNVEATVILTIREVFSNATWELWGTLNDLLPILAEAAPNEFLNAVDKALGSSHCPFDMLFSNEDSGIFGHNYLTGLLWALESLAWDDKYLVRVCAILGELANHDPGGNWANRPANSLTTILLPWFPQTTAPIEKRKVAVKTLCKNLPEVAWNLLISLLPNQNQVSMESHKPSWRKTIPEDWKNSVTQEDYWNQITFYSELAISIAEDSLKAENNIDKLNELIGHIDNLPKSAIDNLLVVLSSKTILELEENTRSVLWNSLKEVTLVHRQFKSAEWALDGKLLSSIEEIADKLAPSNPLNLYQRLFLGSNYYLFVEKDNYNEQLKELNERRVEAINKILALGGIDKIIEFVKLVEYPNNVGTTLGNITDEDFDKDLLPHYLESKDCKLSQFVRAYIRSRYETYGSHWIDDLEKVGWEKNQIVNFLCDLPFENEIWMRVDEWLETSQSLYWERVDVNPYQAEVDLDIAIDKLLEHKRPNAAISCLYVLQCKGQTLDTTQCVRALLAALSTKEPSYSYRANEIIDIIIALQKDPDVEIADLIKIEWAYLPLFNQGIRGEPKTLKNKLARDPEFFCEIIQLIYHSNKEKSAAGSRSEKTAAIAQNAWKLLHDWNVVPGTRRDGSFSDSDFKTWLERVQEICTESGHLEVALNKVGEVLIYSPPDGSGLWINRTIAEVLNAREAEYLRMGFEAGIINSRGVHDFVPSGKPELALSDQYSEKAEELEDACYYRFAVTLRNLSETYKRKAYCIIENSGNDDFEDK